MLSRSDLNNIGIFCWSDISNAYKNSDLLLGNGFSLNLKGGGNLNYSSLFSEFLTHCSKADKLVFSSFGTHNFELILEKLISANNIDALLGIPTQNKIGDSIDKLRAGLIKAIEIKHPSIGEIDQTQLRRIAYQCSLFNDIYTLNYDLFLYHIIMMISDLHEIDDKVRRYNDYFWHKFSDSSLQFMGYQIYEEYKHIYFLHGALFIFQTSFDTILKVRKRRDINDDSELIDVIRDTIRNGHLPLFVSEGTYKDKLESIERSPYLRFALEHFEKASNNLIIYGTSLSGADSHIARAIKKSGRSLAISVHIGDKDIGQLTNDKLTIEKRVRKDKSQNIEFFDSSTLFNF